MADRGINTVRVPISTQLLLEWKAGTFLKPNVNTYANPELEGKNSLQIFDYWLTLCEKYGIKVFLDVHSAEADNSGHVYPVWWKGSITTEDVYAGWEWVADAVQEQRHDRRRGRQERAARDAGLHRARQVGRLDGQGQLQALRSRRRAARSWPSTRTG